MIDLLAARINLVHSGNQYSDTTKDRSDEDEGVTRSRENGIGDDHQERGIDDPPQPIDREFKLYDLFEHEGKAYSRSVTNIAPIAANFRSRWRRNSRGPSRVSLCR